MPVFGLGCAGGVTGLATAARLAAAEPGSNWLFVSVETCSISIRLDSDDPAAIVATALFGDGAAAAVVSTEGEGLATIRGAGEKLWPDTLGIMGWRVEDPGLAVIFDRAIPPFVEAELAVAIDAILAGIGLTRADIDRFCCHPGGTKVVDAIETALELGAGTLDLERAGASRPGQYERADGAVRARRADRARPARARDDDRLRPRLHLRRDWCSSA